MSDQEEYLKEYSSINATQCDTISASTRMFRHYVHDLFIRCNTS